MELNKSVAEVSDELNWPTLVFGLNNLPPLDAALSIELILTEILSYLSIRDLKNCRLVSKAWRVHATSDKLLNKIRSPTSFTKYNEKKDKEFTRKNHRTKQKRSLTEFIELLNVTKTNKFPSNNFYFNSGIYSLSNEDGDLQKFLKLHGYRLKQLEIDIQQSDTKTCDKDNNTGLLLKFISNLLSNQAINLQQLKIYLEGRFTSKEGGSIKNKANKDEQSAGCLNLNLRYITFGTPIPQSLFECVCNIAPKLDQINLSDENLNYFIQPENRLYLLKTLDIEPPDSVDILEKISKLEGQLELRTIYLHLNNTYKLKESWKKVAQILTIILEKSAHSLEEITWTRMRYLAEAGAKIPKMPKLKRIFFADNSWDLGEEHFFPKRFRISESFPNLKQVSIDRYALDEVMNSDNFLLDNDDEIVSSVKMLVYHGVCDNVPFKQFKKWFPNAIFL